MRSDLTNFNRGDLVSGNSIPLPNRTEDFTLDALGNWKSFNDDGTSQTRTHNAANELDTNSAGHNPTHDAAGNMTSIPSPQVPALGLTATYDAWNRLVKLSSGSGTLATYRYDGLFLRNRDEKALR